MVLLDDGFQNPTIAKTLSLVVVDAAYGFGNGRVIPAGPLRESLARGLARADAVVLLGTEAEARRTQWIKIGRGICRCCLAVLAPVDGDRLAGSRLLAFAGIGRPEKFFATLRALGAVLVGTRAFPDHHPYRTAEIEQLLRNAERCASPACHDGKGHRANAAVTARRDRRARGGNPLARPRGTRSSCRACRAIGSGPWT